MKKLSLLLTMSALALGIKTQAQDAPRFRIAAHGGYSYRIGKVPSSFSGDTRDYMKKLKSGFNVGADVQYYFNDEWGVGVKYLRFQASGNGVIYVDDPADGRTRTNVSDNIGISFYGATFCGRVYTKKDYSQAFLIGAALGYMRYRDNGGVSAYPVTIRGGALGTGLDVGYDIRIARKLYAGAQFSYLAGTLGRITIEQPNMTVRRELKDDQKENLAHLSLSVGLRFHL
ncbi:outer membrane beta-barrel protein [Chitinophaga varians]|uniref:outer membrane beta-barrel protein n=1 Tax=Chitinophaga varians TaxID=2202339 RepID=UPI00165FD456|nr:outer membrane beta-barrel protein [Chitinophaga varians]MBC9909970.1 outer membrane beta-barrel protein [Chitinophaga varians]